MKAKYISVNYSGNSLFFGIANKKEKGGALTTLKKIETIIGAHTLSQQQKNELHQKAQKILEGYLKKNENSLFLRSNTAKVESVAKSITHLTTAPTLPMDILGLIGQSLGAPDLSALSRINKEGLQTDAPHALTWEKRALERGWDGQGGAPAAKAFVGNLQNALRRLGLTFTSSTPDVIRMVQYRAYQLSQSELPVIVDYLLSKKDIGSDEACRVLFTQSYFPEAKIKVVKLAAHWNCSLPWDTINFYRSNIKVEDLRPLAALVPPSWMGRLIVDAITHSRETWLEALLETQADLSKVDISFDPLIVSALKGGNPKIISLIASKRGGRDISLYRNGFQKLGKLSNKTAYAVLKYMKNCLEDVVDLQEKSWMKNRIFSNMTYNNSDFECMPLQRGMRNNWSQETIQLVLDLGYDVIQPNVTYCPIKIAKRSGREDIAAWLQHQADWLKAQGIHG